MTLAHSLNAAETALIVAGLAAERRPGPRRYGAAAQADALWVAMPGVDAFAVVTAGPLRQIAGTWYPVDDPYYAGETTPGWSAGFHEQPFRTRGHPYEDAAGRLSSPTLDDVVRQVVDWTRWEEDWSVAVPVEPAKKRLQRLERIIASRKDSSAVPVPVRLDPIAAAMLDHDQHAAMQRLLENLSLDALRWHFPRDKAGLRLAGRAQVLLAECAPPRNRQGKGVWLTATGPVPRQPPEITIGLTLAHANGAFHRWDGLPEYWLRTERPRSPEQIWGMDPGVGASHERVAHTVEKLVTGNVREALADWDVAIGYEASRLLDGLPTAYGMREWTDKWVAGTAEALAGSAPWLWARAVAGRRAAPRLVNLGGFNPSRRPGLFLVNDRGRVRLESEPSATNLVLPRVEWERDVDLDLTLTGLLDVSAIPSSQS